MTNLVYIRAHRAIVEIVTQVTRTATYQSFELGGSIKLGTTPGGGPRAGPCRISSSGFDISSATDYWLSVIVWCKVFGKSEMFAADGRSKVVDVVFSFCRASAIQTCKVRPT
jgi:hypothetical protein